MADVCTIKKATELTLNFVASITIPIGFKIIGNGEDPTYPYTTYISIDKASVKGVLEEELRPSVITIPDLDNEDPAATTTIDCQSLVRVFKLRGPLFYNSIVSGFVAKDALAPAVTGEGVIAPPTAFSDSKPIQINGAIAYSCRECDFPTDFLQGFDVEIAQQQEFLVDQNGTIILHNPDAPETFMNALKGEYTEVIHIPYTLTLTPKTTL